MRRAPIRLSCPACLGLALEVTPVTSGATIQHCRRCGGTWLLRRQVPRLRAASARALRVMIRRANDAGFLCHDCHAPMDRDAASCPGCGWGNRLECPGCGKPMHRKSENSVTVDVCPRCEGVWLDHHELSAALWTAAAAGAAMQARGGMDIASAVGDGSSFLSDALWYSQDLTSGMARGVDAAGTGVEAAGHATGSAVELVSHTGEAGMHVGASLPEITGGVAEGAGGFAEAAGGLAEAAGGLAEAAGGMAEVAGEAAGGVFSLILEVIGAIFEGLGSVSG